MHLSGLFIYPVKSLRGLAVSAAAVDEFGFVGDRRFMVVDEQNQFLTQRALPRMALITTELGRDSLILRNPHHGSAAVGLHEPGAPLTVQVWRDTVEAEACSVEIAVWPSDFLRQPCRLVRIGQ
nr:MOSC domain-containing protein [Opitutaceae bacterium]